MRAKLRLPYAYRHVPEASLATLLPVSASPQPGDMAVARLEKIGKNTRFELANGRVCGLREGDLLAVVFGNRYATHQFEGYALSDGPVCDLLSMGGVCGLVKSRCDGVVEPSKLRLLGALGNTHGHPLNLREFAIPSVSHPHWPHVVVVCGSSMDAGKTHTAASLVIGLQRLAVKVAAIKLTGTATGRDLWKVLDTGVCAGLDFVDGGYPSTYLCTLDELVVLHRKLVAHAAARGAEWVVIEIADGLLQRETAALLQSPAFTSTVDAWVFAASDPLGALGGIWTLHRWGISPLATSGILSMSPLASQEAQLATGVQCMTAAQLESGMLNQSLLKATTERAGYRLAGSGPGMPPAA
jgi:hypothetical protein